MIKHKKGTAKKEADALVVFARTLGTALGTVAAKITPAKKTARRRTRKTKGVKTAGSTTRRSVARPRLKVRGSKS
jgi:hypothetical protein